MSVTNQLDKGYVGSAAPEPELTHAPISQKSVQLSTTGALSSRASVSALWGPKALDSLVDFELSFDVEREKTALKRLQR